jgi:hypothetical protein
VLDATVRQKADGSKTRPMRPMRRKKIPPSAITRNYFLPGHKKQRWNVEL